MSAHVKRALIVGGGIGGLTTAVALGRAGIEAEIVEVQKEWTVYGVGIIQPSNALRALTSAGLGDACVASGGGFPGWRVHDAQGHVLAEVPGRNVAKAGYPAINGIARSRLHAILTEAVRAAGVPLHLGVTVATLSNRADRVDVVFTDGRRGSYDLLIAADGCHSKVRGMIVGDDMRPTPIGQAVWRYNFRRPPGMEWGGLYYGTKSKAGLVPMSPSSMYMFLVTPFDGGSERLPDRTLADRFREHLAEYGGPIAELRAELVDPRAVVYRPIESLLLPAPWYRGRVVILGDAAHTTSPHLAQGASMAIEDGVLLAGLLADGRRTDGRALEAALTEWMQRRMARVQLVVDTSLELARLELRAWAGAPDPHVDPGVLLHRATEAMMEPI